MGITIAAGLVDLCVSNGAGGEQNLVDRILWRIYNYRHWKPGEVKINPVV